jgi:putative membrane protein
MVIPYCGIPAVPGAISWNFDAPLIACLAAAAVAHYRALRFEPIWRRIAAGAGWAIVALALVSPLCNLSVALFSARVGQHMIIALIGAPLIALSLPRRRVSSREILAATASFGVIFWLWHAPALYEATFASTPVYWAMHLSMFGTALWLAISVIGVNASPLHALASSFFTGLHMSLLGALLTFSANAWFGVHATTTMAWGFSALDDQQLGGLLMWVPAGLLVTVYGTAAFGLELLTPKSGPVLTPDA